MLLCCCCVCFKWVGEHREDGWRAIPSFTGQSTHGEEGTEDSRRCAASGLTTLKHRPGFITQWSLPLINVVRILTLFNEFISQKKCFQRMKSSDYIEFGVKSWPYPPVPSPAPGQSFPLWFLCEGQMVFREQPKA